MPKNNKGSSSEFEQVIVDLSSTLIKLIKLRHPEIDTENPKTERNFLTIRQLVEKYNFLKEGTVRWYIHQGEYNGFNGVIKRMGSRILIEEDLFLKWIDKPKGKKK